jgi:hypothetical protein
MFILVTKNIAQEFGDRFLLVMLHWCEIGRRSFFSDKEQSCQRLLRYRVGRMRKRSVCW